MELTWHQFSSAIIAQDYDYDHLIQVYKEIIAWDDRGRRQ